MKKWINIEEPEVYKYTHEVHVYTCIAQRIGDENKILQAWWSKTNEVCREIGIGW